MIKLKKRLLQGDALLKRAEELGVSQHGLCTEKLGNTNEAILQQRVIEAERQQREHRLWLIAVISAIASVFSALAAWLAVFSTSK
jgi:hypothetical protein